MRIVLVLVFSLIFTFSGAQANFFNSCIDKMIGQVKLAKAASPIFRGKIGKSLKNIIRVLDKPALHTMGHNIIIVQHSDTALVIASKFKKKDVKILSLAEEIDEILRQDFNGILIINEVALEYYIDQLHLMKRNFLLKSALITRFFNQQRTHALIRWDSKSLILSEGDEVVSQSIIENWLVPDKSYKIPMTPLLSIGYIDREEVLYDLLRGNTVLDYVPTKLRGFRRQIFLAPMFHLNAAYRNEKLLEHMKYMNVENTNAIHQQLKFTKELLELLSDEDLDYVDKTQLTIDLGKFLARPDISKQIIRKTVIDILEENVFDLRGDLIAKLEERYVDGFDETPENILCLNCAFSEQEIVKGKGEVVELRNYRKKTNASSPRVKRQYQDFQEVFPLSDWDKETIQLINQLEERYYYLKVNRKDKDEIWNALITGEMSPLFRLKKHFDVNSVTLMFDEAMVKQISKMKTEKRLLLIEQILQESVHYSSFKMYLLKEYGNILKVVAAELEAKVNQ